jgi:uncharacterized protein YjhX (UPF0386 family)
MEVTDQLHASAALPPGKSTDIYSRGGWLDSAVGLDVFEKRKI